MTKTAAASLAAAVLALNVISQPSAAEVQPYPPKSGGWIVAPGYYGFSGYPWPSPPFAGPLPAPTYGCYFTRARLQNAWRRVEVCH